MKKGTQTRQVVEYEATEEARRTPRRYQLENGVWIGLGGSVTLPAQPPRQPLPITYREATPQEYEQLKHLTHLVKQK